MRLLLERNGRAFVLWACRGDGKGCKRNEYRKRDKHCDDCVLASPEETLEQLQARIDRGDA